MSAPRLNFPYSGGGGGGGISGSGTTGYVAKFTSGTAVGDSLVRDNGSQVSIDVTPSPGYKLTVNGDTTIVGRIDALTGSINTITSRASTDLVLQRDTVTAATIKAGAIATLTGATPAATNGNYANLALTGGTGTGATADIVVTSGAVSSVTIRAPGNGYTGGDLLTCPTLTGLGAGVTVATVATVILEIEGAANIMTSGRLAAGTTNGTEQLTVSAGSVDRIGMNVVGSVSTLTFGSTNSTGAIRTIAYDRGGAAWTFNYGNNPGPLSTALTIDNSGVASFGGPVRATGTSASAPAFTGSDTDTGIYFPASNQVRLSTNATPALSIDASQNVGISNTTGTILGKLHVGSGTTAPVVTTPGLIVTGTTSEARLVVKESTVGAEWFVLPSTTQVSMGNVNAYNLEIKTSNAARLIVGSTGIVTVGATAGTTANTLDVSTAGWGVKLPATPGNGNANTLDCYEEGSYTATAAAFTVTGASPTQPLVVVQYTRIGRIVTLTGKVTLNAGTTNWASTIGGANITLPTGTTFDQIDGQLGAGLLWSTTGTPVVYSGVFMHPTQRLIYFPTVTPATTLTHYFTLQYMTAT